MAAGLDSAAFGCPVHGLSQRREGREDKDGNTEDTERIEHTERTGRDLAEVRRAQGVRAGDDSDGMPGEDRRGCSNRPRGSGPAPFFPYSPRSLRSLRETFFAPSREAADRRPRAHHRAPPTGVEQAATFPGFRCETAKVFCAVARKWHSEANCSTHPCARQSGRCGASAVGARIPSQSPPVPSGLRTGSSLHSPLRCFRCSRPRLRALRAFARGSGPASPSASEGVAEERRTGDPEPPPGRRW